MVRSAKWQPLVLTTSKKGIKTMNPDLRGMNPSDSGQHATEDSKNESALKMSRLKEDPDVKEWIRLNTYVGRHQDVTVTDADWRRIGELENTRNVSDYKELMEKHHGLK